jgi:hypothetical protein
MKTKVLVFVAVLALAMTVPAGAGRLSQDPDALSFLGNYEATLLVRGSQRIWDLTLSSVDDNGNVKVSRYHLSAVGSYPEEDVSGVTGVFRRENGKPQIFLNVPGRAKIILTKEKGGLSAEAINSNIGRQIVHLEKK